MTEISMKNKCVLITGASSGIGYASAKRFAQAGAKIILCARRKERLEQAAAEFLDKYQVKSYVLGVDISKQKLVTQALSQLPEEWKHIDVLVNNAGLALSLDKIADGLPDDWDQIIDTNIKGTLYFCKAVLPDMIARNTGHIINVGSLSSHEVYVGGVAYCASKHALKAITQGLRKELLETKIKITAVDPGMVQTEISQVRFKNDMEKANKVYEGIEPLSADEVADAIYYVATRPLNVNINELIIAPQHQATAATIFRNTEKC